MAACILPKDIDFLSEGVYLVLEHMNSLPGFIDLHILVAAEIIDLSAIAVDLIDINIDLLF